MYKFNPKDNIELEACLTLDYGAHSYNVANFGHVFYIAGPKGSAKSTHARTICASGLAKKPIINFNLDLQGRKILMCDCENPLDIFHAAQKRMLDLAGLKKLPKNYEAISLLDIEDPEEKREQLFGYIEKDPDIGVIIIDVFADLVLDENDNSAANEIMSYLVTRAKAHNQLIIPISHVSDASKLLGILGRKIDRKASGGVMMERHGNYTTITKNKSRYGDFPSVEFTIDRETQQPIAGGYIPFGLG